MSTFSQNYTIVDLVESNRAEIIDLERWAFPSQISRDEMLAGPDPIDYRRTAGIRFSDSGQPSVMQTTNSSDSGQPSATQATNSSDNGQPSVMQGDTDGQLVAMRSSFAWERFPVPGGTAPVAGLTMVSVHPEHRRRGLLNTMIDEHFSRCAARKEAFSVLVATEPVIYGRYGYGRAADSFSLTLNRGAALRSVEGSEDIRVRIFDLNPAIHAQLIDELHRAVAYKGRLSRPGWATRDTQSLRERIVFEYQANLQGSEEFRLMLAEHDGKPVGYALFNRNDTWKNWSDEGPNLTVDVREYAASDGAATHALWSRLLDMDLTTKVKINPLSVDDPLLTMLVAVEPTQNHFGELLWVRLIDLPQALKARQYASDVDVVLEVTDTRLAANQGRWRLTATAFNSDVQVERTDADPVICLDIRELGAIYLGGTSLAALAAAGLVKVTCPKALIKTAAAFHWPIAPGCSWHF